MQKVHEDSKHEEEREPTSENVDKASDHWGSSWAGEHPSSWSWQAVGWFAGCLHSLQGWQIGAGSCIWYACQLETPDTYHQWNPFGALVWNRAGMEIQAGLFLLLPGKLGESALHWLDLSYPVAKWFHVGWHANVDMLNHCDLLQHVLVHLKMMHRVPWLLCLRRAQGDSVTALHVGLVPCATMPLSFGSKRWCRHPLQWGTHTSWLCHKVEKDGKLLLGSGSGSCNHMKAHRRYCWWIVHQWSDHHKDNQGDQKPWSWKRGF